MVFRIILAIALVLTGVYVHPLIFGLILAAVLLFLGIASYKIRQSGAALYSPVVDRFFQQVPCYLSIQDKDLKIIRTNELFRKDFGDRIGEYCFKVYKGYDEICPNCSVKKTFEDGKTYTTEETVITKDGKLAQMIVNTTPVYDEIGKIKGVMEMSTNITQVKQLQEEIETSRKEFMDLFEKVPCYISVQDRDFKIVRSNNLFKQEFGDNTGKCCYEVYKKQNTVCNDCHVARTMQDGKIYSKETTIIKKDGTTANVIAYSSPIYNKEGEITSVMELSTDITEVKNLQRELTNMGKTIATMAHRIKNILMGLEGGIFVVNTGMEDEDQDMIKQGWGMIQRNVEKVARIVKDLLYCSKEREMEFKNIDPCTVISSVNELFRDRAAKEGIEFSVIVPEKMPIGKFDPDALHSLLTNFIINAFDACAIDSTEGKDSHMILVNGSYSEDDNKYIFEVEDNGQGIPGHVGENVFEDFFSTKGREGTGLGLLVAHKIVEEHGGIITFTSEVGKGTTFKAVFPHKIID